MDKEELLERYEADGDESLYAEAKRRYEQALAANPGDARLLEDYGYLQECHGRRSIRAAASCYERVIEADPEWVKPHLQLIGALAALRERTSRHLAETLATGWWHTLPAATALRPYANPGGCLERIPSPLTLTRDLGKRRSA